MTETTYTVDMLFAGKGAIVRAIYERLLDRERVGAEGQNLLEPLLLELQPHQAEVLEARVPFLEGLGFRCQRFGGREFLVSAIPNLSGGADLGPHLPALLEEAAAPDDAWQGRLLASLACRAAIRRGRAMDAVEMETLLGELAATQAPAVCPHGSALILHFSAAFLERQFDW